jgi:hypothetical protein
MTLKINTYDDGWRYIGSISSIQVKEYIRDGSSRNYDCIFLRNHILDNELTSLTPKEYPVKELCVWYEVTGKKPDTFLVDTATYLMNEDGKTIDKLN